jgi:hypothetical protein
MNYSFPLMLLSFYYIPFWTVCQVGLRINPVPKCFWISELSPKVYKYLRESQGRAARRGLLRGLALAILRHFIVPMCPVLYVSRSQSLVRP